MKYYLLAIALFLLNLTGCSPQYQGPQHQSWFVPGYGTVNIFRGQPPQSPVVTSGTLTRDVIVLSDLGCSVDYINADGSVKWRHNGCPERIMDLQRWDDGTVSYISNQFVVLLDINTGVIKSTFSPLHQQLRQYQRVGTGYLAIASEKVVLLDNTHKVIWENPHPASYPRSAIVVGNTVVIADTFNHRVYGVDLTSDEIVFTTKDYYPNQVQDVGGILVTAEHSNRIYILNPDTLERTLVFACDEYPFNDVYSTTEQILALQDDQAKTLLIDPAKPEWSKSICANKLYSPNGAYSNGDGTFFITSTDDGAVLEVKDGEIIAKITGFNNPARVIGVR